jgi:hypothetical protein
MVLFWCDYKTEARREMNAASRLALDLGMSRREFATEHGGKDLVLRECWRRTWWELFVVDSYYAGTLGTLESAFMDAKATVELPCEEFEYELGVSTGRHFSIPEVFSVTIQPLLCVFSY